MTKRYALIPAEVITRLSPPHLKVWAALASFADDSGICFPSLQRLADEASYSLDWVQRVLKELVALGEVELRPRGRFYLPARDNLSNADESDNPPEASDDCPEAHIYQQTTSSHSSSSPPGQPEVEEQLTVIAESWLPSEQDIGYLLTHRLDLYEHTLRITQHFINWHRARRIRLADWSAAWRAWIIKQQRSGPHDSIGNRDRQNNHRYAASDATERGASYMAGGSLFG